ncbi:carbohydrate ABC transporter permease [Paenibacillus lignilyticus]|uniref:Carbohydrate ABC transporter permease n=1 Tax=Paenibacillus lignilyticus TaxID=1172615 RepID=A0ABS5C6A5_9BACL|nr:carbohydrate ABC transporter permease [Paenibacillus lignilyticus]MBP3961523.1 carbohydrate ABC transporter permease [Paenibacillus lignilyticus]MBP3963807.1 carbohydrate ABC transporter permease [Paenibacillus lignilyticus]
MSHESNAYKLFKYGNISLLFILVVAMIFPYVNVLAIAFNDPMDSQFGGITFWPRVFTIDNFKVLLQNKDVITATGISVLRVIIGTLIALVVQYMCAYAFTIKDFKGKAVVLMFLMIPMYFNGGLIPQYLLFSKMHMLNSFLVYVLPVSFSLYNMVIIRSYLYSIPGSLAESARIDGANEFIIMFRVYVPLSMPIIAVLALWSAVGHWNDWTTTLYFITDKHLYTLQYILMQILREGERVTKLMEEAIRMGTMGATSSPRQMTPAAIRAANIIITTIPIVIIYPFLQKYFVQGITLGAVKE